MNNRSSSDVSSEMPVYRFALAMKLSVPETVAFSFSTVYSFCGMETFNSMSNFEQAKARIHRAGQKENCHYIYLVCRGTVDRKVLYALRQKMNLAKMLVDDYRKGRNPFKN